MRFIKIQEMLARDFYSTKNCSLPVDLKHLTSAMNIINKNDTRTLGMNVQEKMQMPTENYVL